MPSWVQRCQLLLYVHERYSMQDEDDDDGKAAWAKLDSGEATWDELTAVLRQWSPHGYTV